MWALGHSWADVKEGLPPDTPTLTEEPLERAGVEQDRRVPRSLPSRPRVSRRKSAGLTLAAAAVMLPLLAATAGPAAAGPDVRRIAGTDRYATAVAISQASHPTGAPVVVLTTGGAFPDALAGGPAAAALGAPVLLIATDSVPPVVVDELDRLNPARVLLLGGTAAVSPTPVDELEQAGYAVERIAGAGRYETAALVSQEVFSAGTPVVYIATGEDYPDALAGAAAAAAADAPVLLVAQDALPQATAEELTRLKPQRVVVLGGPNAVSATVEQSLASYAPTVTRISGADRYATAAAVARATPGRPDEIFLATGQGFADALAGGPAAAAAGAPVLLVPPTCIPGPVHAEMQRHEFPPVILLGGNAVLTGDVAELRPCFRAPDGELAPGVILSTISDPRGPWSGKVVSVAPSAIWRLRPVLAQDMLPGLETTSSMSRRTNAIIAVNGDFALAGGRPVHAFAQNGRLVQTPQTLGRNVAVESVSSAPRLGFPDVDVALEVDGVEAPVTRVNSGSAGPDGLALATAQAGNLSPVPAGSCAARLTVAGAPYLDPDGRAVQSQTVGEVRCGSPLSSGTGDVLYAAANTEWAFLLEDLVVGERVLLSWSLGWRDVLDSLGGNPTLMEQGAVVEGNVAGTDGFSNRNPRTAVGYKPDGTLLLVTVDGRGRDGSVGMSLRELAALFVRLGASDALNLDGGGSTTMVIGDQVQNSPSDGPERAVSSALILVPGSRPEGGLRTQSTTPSDPAIPLPVREEADAEQRLLSDPGSTGGLSTHLNP